MSIKCAQNINDEDATVKENKINVSRQIQCNFLFGVIIHAAFYFRFQLYTLSRKLLLV